MRADARRNRDAILRAAREVFEVDGIFGDATETAVKVVQRCGGLRADGLVDPRTWHYLDRPEPGCEH